MNIKKMGITELEQYSYSDIAYKIIKETKKKYNTPNLFKEICKLLNLNDEEFEEKIGDFFTALSTDQRFLLIDSINWDLKENHKVNVVVDDGEEDEEIREEIESDEEETTETEDDLDEDDYGEEALDDEIDSEDGLEDLTIVNDEETEE